MRVAHVLALALSHGAVQLGAKMFADVSTLFEDVDKTARHRELSTHDTPAG